MTLELARRLLATGAIAARDVEAALYLSVVRGVSIARALVDRGVLSERALEDELNRRAGLPLRHVHPAPEIIARLPRGMCRMLAAVPLRHDPASNTTEIAAVDPLDGHVASEFTFHLGTPIRVQRATMASIEEAIRRLELADGNVSVRPRRRTPAFPHGAPESVPPSAPPSQPPPDEVPIPLIRRVPPERESERGLVTPRERPHQRATAEDASPRFTDEPFPGSSKPTPPPPPAKSESGQHPLELPVLFVSAASDRSFTPIDLPRAHVDDDPDDEPTRLMIQQQRRKVMQSAPDIPTTSFPSIPPSAASPSPSGSRPNLGPRPYQEPEPLETKAPSIHPPPGPREVSDTRGEPREEANRRNGAPSEAPESTGLPLIEASPTSEVVEAPPSTTPAPAMFSESTAISTSGGVVLGGNFEDEQTPIDSDVPEPYGPEPEAIPRSLDAGWAPTLPELLDLIGRARARDDLLDLVLRALTLVAQRTAVFVVRREGFMGWSCNPAFGSEEDLRRVTIPSAQPSIFATSAATGFYLGPIPRTPVHAPLLRVIGRASPDVAVYVAKAQGRPALVVVADQLDDTLLGTRALGEIAKRAGEALTRVLGQR